MLVVWLKLLHIADVHRLSEQASPKQGRLQDHTLLFASKVGWCPMSSFALPRQSAL